MDWDSVLYGRSWFPDNKCSHVWFLVQCLNNYWMDCDYVVLLILWVFMYVKVITYLAKYPNIYLVNWPKMWFRPSCPPLDESYWLVMFFFSSSATMRVTLTSPHGWIMVQFDEDDHSDIQFFVLYASNYSLRCSDQILFLIGIIYL